MPMGDGESPSNCMSNMPNIGAKTCISQTWNFFYFHTKDLFSITANEMTVAAREYSERYHIYSSGCQMQTAKHQITKRFATLVLFGVGGNKPNEYDQSMKTYQQRHISTKSFHHPPYSMNFEKLK